MGLRFHYLNPIYRFLHLSRISSPKNPRPNYVIHSLNSGFRYNPDPVFSENPHFLISKRWHLGHSHGPHDHHNHHHQVSEEAENIFRLGLVADIGLAAGKALTGYVCGSTAIIADAAHSVSDVVLSGIALLSFKAAKAPRDKEHPYGHGKFETLGALAISSMLLATSGGIAWHAVQLLLEFFSTNPEVVNHSLTLAHTRSHEQGGHHHGIDMNHPVLALSMTIVSISIKEGLYWITKRAGEKQGSGLMKANAWHHRADAISSVVALIGVGGSLLGVKFLDPLAGLVVSGMILKAGLETGYQSVLELVDAAIPAQELDPIKQTILQVEGVKGCHRLRGRRAGSSLYLDVHIVVDPFSSVSAAHCIGEKVRLQIHKSHPEVSEVFIHIDPAFIKFSPNTMVISDQKTSNYVEDENLKAIVSNVFSSKFAEKMAVERVTHHLLQGNVLLQVEVNMPPDITIRDAMKLATEVESEIMKAASNVFHVSIQLRLGRPIPHFNYV